MVRHAKADDESFADEYEEDRVEADVDDLSYSRFSGLAFVGDSARDGGGKTAIEFAYTTSHGNTKVVRALQTTRSTSPNTVDRFPADAPLDDGNAYTFHDDGDGYAFTDADGRLWGYGDDHQYRALGDVDDVYRVDLPEAAPVTGAVQDGVTVTVHYRSKRSGNMKTIRLDDVSVDWEGDRVRGYHARRDRRVEVDAVYERSVVSQSAKGGDREVGKCARIDFPPGHTYTVDAYGVTDGRADDVADRIRDVFDPSFGDDVDVEVTHDGRIDD